MIDNRNFLVSHSHIPLSNNKRADKIFVAGKQVAKVFIGNNLIYEYGRLDSDIDVLISQNEIIFGSSDNNYELSYGEEVTLEFYCVDGYGFDDDIKINGATVKSFTVEEVSELN